MIQSTILGAFGVVFGLGTILAQDVIMKALSAQYSVIQLLFIRSVFALVILVCILPLISCTKPLRSNRRGLQILRGSLQFLSFACYYIALQRMPILELVTVFFSAPLIAVALSVPVLKERVGLMRWVALCIGFLGALLIIGPQRTGFNHGVTLLAFGAAVLYAGSIVVTRILGEKDQSVTTALYTLIMYVMLSGITVSSIEVIYSMSETQGADYGSNYWITPTLNHIGMLAIAGLAVCVAFLLLAHAYRQAPVSVLVPWEYSALIWGGLYGYIFWNELPTALTVTGGVLIVVSGIYSSQNSTN